MHAARFTSCADLMFIVSLGQAGELVPARVTRWVDKATTMAQDLENKAKNFAQDLENKANSYADQLQAKVQSKLDKVNGLIAPHQARLVPQKQLPLWMVFILYRNHKLGRT